MPLNISLELSDEDLAYFARVLDSVWKKNSKRPEHELIDGAREKIKHARKAKAPLYVTKRLEEIGVLIDMLDDDEWPLEITDRRRLLAAISYFAVPKDMIADKVPGIGYLDDALMADLVIRELKPDLDGYRDFNDFRAHEVASRGKKVDREEWLAAKRRRLFDRIQRRREQMWERTRERELTDPILRYQY